MSEKPCLVIAPIGEPESETRRRSNQILDHVIRPAASECGYAAVRADEIAEPGLITNTVIQRVVSDPLVIADLTDRNPNVFYELALRHALRRPLVQLIRKGETIPFDVAGMRTISVDHHDLDSVQDAKISIVRQIRSIEKSEAAVETPISIALDLQHLRNSDNPERRTLGELLVALADVRTEIAAVGQRVTTTGPSAHEIFDFIVLAAIAARLTDRMDTSRVKEITNNIQRNYLSWMPSVGRQRDLWTWLFAPPESERPTSGGGACGL